MTKIFTVLTLVIFVGLYAASAEIRHAPTLSPIEFAIRNADSQTLVIFDVDDVLIIDYEKKFKNFFSEIKQKFKEEKADDLSSIVYIEAKNRLIDANIINIIHYLHKKESKALFLTACDTGSWGRIASLEDWRTNDLKSLGIDTEKSFRDVRSVAFKALRPKNQKRIPVFKNGILFTCGVSKGEVLKAFLEYANFLPKEIIFVDDKMKNLDSVEAFCKKTGITFLGFHYTASDSESISSVDEKRLRLKFEILEKEQKWLSDEEMNAYLSFLWEKSLSY